MNLDEVINGKRWVSADYHVVSARAWKQQGQSEYSPSPLIYAAFEYRCAIERIVLELYAVMCEEFSGAEDVSKIGSFSSLIKMVHDLAGCNKKLLYRVLKFNSIVSEFLELEKP